MEDITLYRVYTHYSEQPSLSTESEEEARIKYKRDLELGYASLVEKHLYRCISVTPLARHDVE